MKQFAIYNTLFGPYKITYEGNVLRGLDRLEERPEDGSDVGVTSTFSDTVARELEEYFTGERKTFTFAFHGEGTPFQEKVWQALCQIPYGETRSYKEIAIAVGNPKGSRAVGMANNRNPISIVVPCHRVIGANGKLVGYAGGLEIKDKLLQLEKGTALVTKSGTEPIGIEAEVRTSIEEMAEESNKAFTEKLTPGCTNIAGVRKPKLTKLAKRILTSYGVENLSAYVAAGNEVYMEEVMLKGLIIGELPLSIDDLLPLVKIHIPKITNWALCDSFCSALHVTAQHLGTIWSFIQPYAMSDEAYEIRFAVVMFLAYYIDEAYLVQIFAIFDAVTNDDYYVKMAIAWALSMCFVSYPERTTAYLRHNKLPKWTHNKAIQKIRESRQVDVKTKDFVKTLKR